MKVDNFQRCRGRKRRRNNYNQIMRDRLMVGRSSLEAVILVRIQFPQPYKIKTPWIGVFILSGLFLFVNVLYDLGKY